jgi:hypothetical protein
MARQKRSRGAVDAVWGISSVLWAGLLRPEVVLSMRAAAVVEVHVHLSSA